MDCRHLEIPGPVLFKPKMHGDGRGYFAELFRADVFAREAGAAEFVQENQSLSARAGTLRGLHFQTPPTAQGKLVRCAVGAIFDVAVDLRHGSPTFGRWVGAELTGAGLEQLWVPPGFAHGFCTLVPDTLVVYRVTDYYSPADDRGLRWDDPALAIDWPAVADPETLSPKDRTQPRLADLPAHFHYGA